VVRFPVRDDGPDKPYREGKRVCHADPGGVLFKKWGRRTRREAFRLKHLRPHRRGGLTLGTQPDMVRKGGYGDMTSQGEDRAAALSFTKLLHGEPPRENLTARGDGPEVGAP